MDRKPVTSSNVAAIGYDDENKTLEIEFINGGVYQYDDVPAPIHAALMAADSKGRYVALYVRSHYPTRKIEA